MAFTFTASPPFHPNTASQELLANARFEAGRNSTLGGGESHAASIGRYNRYRCTIVLSRRLAFAVPQLGLFLRTRAA